MKAIVQTSYGPPELLKLQEVPRPELKPTEVMVRVLAASVNKADWHLLRGRPVPVRLMAGLVRPKHAILGADMAGVVEQVGKDVSQFRKGDEVFGDLSAGGFGGFAKYVAAPERLLARKPSTLSFEAAAALPMAAITALQGWRDKGKLQAGQEVLINGASGGVGSLAIQLAKALGATVTAVCSTGKLHHARQQGADRVIDYTAEDFTRGEATYDLILDGVANHSLNALAGVLRLRGTYVSYAFSWEVLLLGAWKAALTGKRFRSLLASARQADLQFLCQLAEEGKLSPPH